jgi:curved DNA-binding protein
LQRSLPNHYATLGLDRRCTPAQIRAAYRLLARQHHPDVNPHSPAAVARTQELNAAHEILSDPDLRAAYDRELDAPKKSSASARPAKTRHNLAQDVYLPPEDFLRGTKREIRINDPANPRNEPFAGGLVQLRVKAQPDFRFKTRGSDLRCDLKIKSERAAQGGVEMVRGLAGTALRVQIPRGVARGEIICISGEGLPKPRGGRGDLLVRINYRVEVHIRRSGK